MAATIVDNVVVSKWATGIRQFVNLANKITGTFPVVAGVPPVLFVTKYERGLYTYCDPTNISTEVADDGGIFVFGAAGLESCSVRIVEIHFVCGAGSTVSAVITDSTGAYPRTILSGVSGVDDRHLPTNAYVLPGQRLVITESASGAPIADPKMITVYAIQDGRV